MSQATQTPVAIAHDADAMHDQPLRLHMTEEEFERLTLLNIFCAQRRLGLVLGENAQVRFERLRRRCTPDILFLSHDRLNQRRKTYIEGAPDLVMEIVLPDSVARDWREKYLEYEAAGVREYWVVDPMAERVEAYVLNAQQRYERLEMQTGKIASRVLPGFYLKPEWLWQDELPNPMDVLAELSAA